MHKLNAILTLFFLSLFSGQVLANEFELSLNDDAVKVAGTFAMGNIDIEGSLLHNQDRGNVLGIAGLVSGNAGEQGLNAGLGLKLAFVDPDFEQDTATILPVPLPGIESPSGGALAVGGKVHYVPAEYNRFNAGGYLWLAPDVLAFDKLTKYQEIGAYVGYNITRNADVFIGYRNVKGKFKNLGTGTIDTGVHFGIRATF